MLWFPLLLLLVTVNADTTNSTDIEVEPEQPIKITTLCNYEGIKVQVNNVESFSGVIFVKNKFDACRVEVANSNSALLNLGLPKDFGMKPIALEEERGEVTLTDKADLLKEGNLEEFKRHRRQVETRDCGIIDLLNGTYKTTVVVQTNNLGIPGLVTAMDQIYEVSCDYSSMLGGKVQTGHNVTVNGPEPNLIQPRGKIELGNPVFMQILGEGEQPIAQAKLGDILELRWEIMAMDDELDFFIRKCHAEPGVKSKAESEPEKLQLIDDGCPTPAVSQKLIPQPIEVKTSNVKIARMQAFRFDTSSTIRITCEIEICKGDCTPVQCANGEKKSWGRKKRSARKNITEFETAQYKVPRYSQATASLVITDPLMPGTHAL